MKVTRVRYLPNISVVFQNYKDKWIIDFTLPDTMKLYMARGTSVIGGIHNKVCTRRSRERDSDHDN